MSSTTVSQPGPYGLRQRRAQLEDRWRARLERVTELALAYHDAAQQAGRAAGPAGLRVRSLARRTVAERQALAEIEAALDRISAGRYGLCEQCGGPIPAALLAGEPQARYCATCARPPSQRTDQAW
jgi:DnaK suppressor protein